MCHRWRIVRGRDIATGLVEYNNAPNYIAQYVNAPLLILCHIILQKMIFIYYTIMWICITVMFHELMTGAVRIINTIFVERVKIKLAEVEAVRLQAQADIIKDRERRRLRQWEDVS